MKRFEKVVDILDTAVSHQAIGAHGNFWRNKTREQFIALKVFGRVLVVPGSSSDSNLISAMRGLSPFGVDVDPPPAGAMFDRMPAQRPAVPELSIQFIEQWIADGCPEDDMAEPPPPVAHALGPQQFVDFFRAFDQFFAFQAGDPTRSAIGDFFNVAQTWPGFNATADLPAWTDAIADPAVRNAAQFLSDNQLRLIAQHFGDPLDQASFNEALWQFGKGSLPPDDQRPQDRLHRMNGSQMWVMWLAFADASIRTGIEAAKWTALARSICLGLVGDALFRTDRPPAAQLKITRYRTDDPALHQHVIDDFAQLEGEALLDAMIGLGREAVFGAPTA